MMFYICTSVDTTNMIENQVAVLSCFNNVETYDMIYDRKKNKDKNIRRSFWFIFISFALKFYFPLCISQFSLLQNLIKIFILLLLSIICV